MDFSILLTLGIGIFVLIIVVFSLLKIVGCLLRKVGPNQALIVYGTGGTKVITGGAHFVIPLYQRTQSLSLELMSLKLPLMLTAPAQREPLPVEAVALIKVRSDAESIMSAAEQFLSKSQQEREDLIRLVLESHLRRMTYQMSGEELLRDAEKIEAQMFKSTAADLDRMGLEMISFSLKRQSQ